MVVGGNQAILAVNHPRAAALFHQLGPVEIIPYQRFVGDTYHGRSHLLGRLDDGSIAGRTEFGFLLLRLFRLAHSRLCLCLIGSTLAAGGTTARGQDAGAYRQGQQDSCCFLLDIVSHDGSPFYHTLLTSVCWLAT